MRIRWFVLPTSQTASVKPLNQPKEEAMLKSYEAMIENGRLKWLSEQPEVQSARIIVTVLDSSTLRSKPRTPPASLVGKAKIKGDIVAPMVGEEDWECLK